MSILKGVLIVPYLLKAQKDVFFPHFGSFWNFNVVIIIYFQCKKEVFRGHESVGKPCAAAYNQVVTFNLS